MKIRALLSNAFTRSKKNDQQDDNNHLVGSYDWLQNITRVGGSDSEKMAAVFNAVRLLSEVPASLPIRLYKQEDHNRTRLFDHPVVQLLNTPNGFQTNYIFFETLFRSLQLHGNAIAVIRFSEQGVPTSIIPVSWLSTVVHMDRALNLIYKISDTKIQGSFLSYEVLHLKINTKDGIIGRSPVMVGRENLALGKSAESFGKEFFDKKGQFKGWVKAPQAFKSEEQYKEWSRKFHGALKDNFSTPVLENNMEYHPVPINNDQAQFIATRQFSIQDVARWFNIPPHLLKDLSRATFSNIEHQNIEFVVYSLRSLIKMVEAELKQKLIDPKEGLTIKYSVDGLLRGDTKTRLEYVKGLTQAGILTRNEARELENLPKIEGLDNDQPLYPAHLAGKMNKKDNTSNTKE
ncbi:phage portal protein [Halosquirtibacter laminarini]|uniref:Phage portal protein n=1 Tax=Halosquirtibacter laminarini TaxID=3374600 RepID=A0AC61NKR6_9BACT|nr:phage portal protein [Prolixibacteraceae bacterium]